MSERHFSAAAIRAVLRRLTFSAAALMGGCYHMVENAGTTGADPNLIARAVDSSGNIRYSLPVNPIVPNANLRLTPSIQLPLESLLIGAAIWYFVDPLAPNWEGEARRLSDDTFAIALRSRRLRSTGGDGEAGKVFRRNAEEIVRSGGFADYTIVSFSEGIESELLGAVRVSEGVIRVSGK